jgi:predicted MFS family arabinose efflux permease
MNSLPRLRRQLYALALFKGLVFWYGIEKLFEASIGLDPQQIIILGMIAQTAVIAFEIPSSIFADRVSRKKILLAANVAFMASCLVLGLSSSFWVYAGGAVIWALSDALFSGVYQAFTYDSLVLIKQEKQYRKIISHMTALELLMLGIVGLFAGLLSTQIGLASNFFLSMIAPIGAIVLLLKMLEPPITRTSELGMTWVKHLHVGLKTISKRAILIASIGSVLIFGLLTIWYEYYQLVVIEVHIPDALFGAAISFLTIGLLVGSLLVSKYKSTLRTLSLVWFLFLAATLLMPVANSYWLVLGIIFFGCIGIKCLELYFEVYVQDHIESSQRATAISLLNTIGHVCFFGLGLGFVVLVSHYSVRTTFLIVSVPFILFGLLTALRGFKDYLSKDEH